MPFLRSWGHRRSQCGDSGLSQARLQVSLGRNLGPEYRLGTDRVKPKLARRNSQPGTSRATASLVSQSTKSRPLDLKAFSGRGVETRPRASRAPRALRKPRPLPGFSAVPSRHCLNLKTGRIWCCSWRGGQGQAIAAGEELTLWGFRGWLLALKT